VYGTGWGAGVKRLNPEQEAATYRGASVAINFDHFDREGFFSDRYLRAAACGCPVLNLTRATLDEAVANVREELFRPLSSADAQLHSAYTMTTDRWHNRVEVLEQWTQQHNA
jgi:hypothetical protein